MHAQPVRLDAFLGEIWVIVWRRSGGAPNLFRFPARLGFHLGVLGLALAPHVLDASLAIGQLLRR